MDANADESSALRRLLKEATERAQALETERDEARAKVLELQLEVGKRILHVFGCAGCHGEHRGIWTQDLTPPERIPNMTNGSMLECQRAYVCPDLKVIVLVSNESEDTFNLCERSHG